MKHRSPEEHRKYLQALVRLGPEGRLRKVFELSQMARDLFRAGLERRFPKLSVEQRQRLYLQRLALCHNRNY